MSIPSLATIVALTVIFGFCLALLRRPWTAAATTFYLLCFALLGSWVKEAYLGVALTMADIYFFLLRPIENFKLFINYPLLGMSLLGVLLGVALCLIVGLRFERPVRFMLKPPLGQWLRVGTALASLALAFGASIISSKESHARVNDGDAYAAFLAMYEMQHVSDVINRLNVFFNNRSVEASLPAAYVQTRFIASETPMVPDPNLVRPDILLVLEESTFNPMLIRGCRAATCDNTMLHPLPIATRTQQGPLLVHTTGGGTWLAEFAVMSGLDWRVFGRGGAYAPVSLAPRLKDSLPLQLRALGYRTIAIYPTDGNFLSAQQAYQHYGFDEFHDARELGLPSEWPDTSDALVFAKTLALVEKRSNSESDQRPLFIFVLTIRNHGPHGDLSKEIPPAFRSAVKDTSVHMADYLARMRDSSQAFGQLAERWLKSPRPRVIAWFGDHQPEAAWDFTERAERLHQERIATNAAGEQIKYLTHYQLTANFGERKQAQSSDALDLSYLSSELLFFAGLPLNNGLMAARELAIACHGLMLDCNDRKLVNDYLVYRIHQLGAVH